MGLPGYLDKQLQSDEHVIYRAHLSWVPFVKRLIIFSLFGAIVGGVIWTVFGIGWGFLTYLVVMILGILGQMSTITKNLGFDIIVTNKRLHYKKGIVTVQDDRESSLYRIDDSDVDYPTISSRIFRYGNLTVQTVNGANEFFDFENVAEPLKLKQEINKARENFGMGNTSIYGTTGIPAKPYYPEQEPNTYEPNGTVPQRHR